MEFRFQALAALRELLPKLRQAVVNDTIQVLQFLLLRLAIKMDLHLEVVVLEPDVESFKQILGKPGQDKLTNGLG